MNDSVEINVIEKMLMDKDNIITSKEDLINAGYKTGELLPCPFCGCENILTAGERNPISGNIVYKAFCTNLVNCGAQVFTCIGGEETKEQARKETVAKWNKRAK